MSELLLYCPLCKKKPGTRTGPPAMARCITPECEGTKLAAYTFAEWNTHAAPPSTETPRHTEVSREEYVRLIDAIDYTLTVHGKIDADTPLHDRIRKVYRAPIPVNFRSSHASLTAKVAELEAALRPFAGDKLPSARRTEIAFDRHGLRRCISPLELARDRAFAALDNADGGRG